MTAPTLSFHCGEDSLSVRRFTARQTLSGLFEVSVMARSPNDDIDLDAIVGSPAAIQLQVPAAFGPPAIRRFAGVCRAMELTRSEPSGLSTYELHIVPALWLLAQRTNHRIFQHASVPDIVAKLLAEWSIPATFRVDRAAHPALEYRVQYGESDLDFVNRLLAEAGISYFFADGEQASELVLTDAPQAAEPRAAGPVPFHDSPSADARAPYVTDVRLGHEVRPGKLTLRDFDFRRRVTSPLFASDTASGPAPSVDPRLERYHYVPGAFVIEKREEEKGAAAASPTARADDAAGRGLARRSLAAARSGRQKVTFRTNLADLSPGTVFSIAGHGRTDLAPDKLLLVTSLTIEGAVDEDWQLSGAAVSALTPHRPAQTTVKPVVHGVQSAVVVGPPGEEIHTDEHGRVRVQFHWDREGQYADGTSCWIRVSQGWAGAGHGFLALPRVGQEVLVGFFEGDPDQPVIVGRAFNATSPPLQRLPEHRSRTTWRSSSTPGGGGHNEITFEDARGAELVYVQAERDLETLVKADETRAVGKNRTKRVGANEAETIGGSQTTTIGGFRTATVGASDSTRVGVRHSVTVAQGPGETAGRVPTGSEMVDRRITFTTGESTLTLDGPDITLEAAAGIFLKAAHDISVAGRANIVVKAGATVRVEAEDGDLVIQGGPIVRINPERGGNRDADDDEDDDDLPVAAPPGADLEETLDLAEQHLWFDPASPAWFEEQTAEGGQWHPLRWGPEFEDFGYFHLAFAARAMGIPEGVLLRATGKKHQQAHGPSPERGDPGNGLWGGQAPFGNDPAKAERMKQGFAHHQRNYQ